MPTLSVVMIVKNEARRLLACLDSVRDIAEEVLVADTGSTDATVPVAEEWGARVVHVPWTDDFAAARNAAVSHAKGDWLLHLDADEFLDPDSARHVRHVVDEDGFSADAVELMIANYCDDPRAWRWTPVDAALPKGLKFSGYLPVPLLRLFRNHRGIQYREPVHENITQSLIDLGGTVLPRHDILIHHYGYQEQSDRREAKTALYLRIAREKRLANPGDLKALHDFAEQALACGLLAEAEESLRAALALDPANIPAVMSLANICLNRGDLVESAELLRRIEGREDAPAHVAIGLSAIDHREGRLLQAMHRLERLLERDPRALLARLYLARIYDRFGVHERAVRQLEIAQMSAPTVQEFQDRLQAIKRRRDAETLFQNGLPHQALELLVSVLQLDPEDPLVHNDLGVVLFSLGERKKAEASLRRALQLAPGLAGAAENLEKLRAGK